MRPDGQPEYPWNCCSSSCCWLCMQNYVCVYIYIIISRLWFGYKHTKPLLFFPPSNFPHDVSVVLAWTVCNCMTWIWGCSNMCTSVHVSNLSFNWNVPMVPGAPGAFKNAMNSRYPMFRHLCAGDIRIAIGEVPAFLVDTRQTPGKNHPLRHRSEVHNVKMPGESTMYYDHATRPILGLVQFFWDLWDGQTWRIHLTMWGSSYDKALIMV